MPRYIDADKINYTTWVVGRDENAGYSTIAFKSDIDQVPTADVVKVVRCKDCRHFRKIVDMITYCAISGAQIWDDDYCSYGEREENNDEKQ